MPSRRRRRFGSTRHNRAGPTVPRSKNPAPGHRARRTLTVRAVAMETIADQMVTADPTIIAVIAQTLFNRTTQILPTVAVNRTMVTATVAAMAAAIIAVAATAGPARFMMAGAAMTTMAVVDTPAAPASLALTADAIQLIVDGDGHRVALQALSSSSPLSAIAVGHAIIHFQLQSLSYRHMGAGPLVPPIPLDAVDNDLAPGVILRPLKPLR